jgi:pimeloyl-ACP methyl ester carboxylesterase
MLVRNILFGLFFTSLAWSYPILPTEIDTLSWDQSTVLGAFASPSSHQFLAIAMASPRPGVPLSVRLWKAQGGVTPKGLVILIPGTGADADSHQSAGFASTLSDLQYDVMVVTNPFSRAFQKTFSKDQLIGFPQNDSPEFVKMMEAAYKAYLQRRKVPKVVHVAGISLGGTYAVRFAGLKKSFKVDKFIAINPPVSFGRAMDAIDDSIRMSLNKKYFSLGEVLVDILPLVDLAWIRQVRLDTENFGLFKARISKNAGMNQSLIGASFQFSLKQITMGMLGTPRFKDLYQRRTIERGLGSMTFARYMGLAGNAIESDYIRHHSFADLIEEGNLTEQFKMAPDIKKVYVIHSEDDFLLAPGDLGVVDAYLGTNLQVLRSGGHCGAIWTKSFEKAVARIL